MLTQALQNAFNPLIWQNMDLNVDRVNLDQLRFVDDIVLIGASIEKLNTILGELNEKSFTRPK